MLNQGHVCSRYGQVCSRLEQLFYQIFFLTLGIGSYLHSFVISEQKNISYVLVLPCRCIHGIRGLLFFAKKQT